MSNLNNDTHEVTITCHIGIHGSHNVNIERKFTPNGDTIPLTLSEIMHAALVAVGEDPSELIGEGNVMTRRATVVHSDVGAQQTDDPDFEVPEQAQIVIDKRHGNAA